VIQVEAADIRQTELPQSCEDGHLEVVDRDVERVALVQDRLRFQLYLPAGKEHRGGNALSGRIQPLWIVVRMVDGLEKCGTGDRSVTYWDTPQIGDASAQ
jgi:hypothetical protein